MTQRKIPNIIIVFKAQSWFIRSNTLLAGSQLGLACVRSESDENGEV